MAADARQQFERVWQMAYSSAEQLVMTGDVNR
jgi:hypothetical protein